MLELSEILNGQLLLPIGKIGSYLSVVPVKGRLGCMKAKDFDGKFERGVSVTRHLDLSAARRPGLEQRRVNVDLPKWMIESLEREAKRLGVTRQSIIKMWLAERLEKRTA